MNLMGKSLLTAASTSKVPSGKKGFLTPGVNVQKKGGHIKAERLQD
jgi:hypothetical protein